MGHNHFLTWTCLLPKYEMQFISNNVKWSITGTYQLIYGKIHLIKSNNNWQNGAHDINLNLLLWFVSFVLLVLYICQILGYDSGRLGPSNSSSFLIFVCDSAHWCRRKEAQLWTLRAAMTAMVLIIWVWLMWTWCNLRKKWYLL